MVIEEIPGKVGSATLVAVTLNMLGLGFAAGAVYSPPLVIVPTVLLPPTTPFTAQVTAVLETPETVAVNWAVSLTCRLSEAGDTTTAATTWSFCVSDLVGSAWLTAVTVIFGLAGNVVGGV